MAVSKNHVDEFVALYDDGNGDSISDIHAAYPAYTKAAITYHLKQRGVLVEKEKTVTASTADFDEPAAQTDELAALLANPTLAAKLDALILARVAQLGVAPAAQSAASSDQMQAFAEAMKRLIDTQAMQMPGYIKPLPLEEVERRLAGKVDMFALLTDFQRSNTPPLWTVGEKGFVECTNMQEFAEGEQIRTYLPPVEDFIPGNAQAEQVHEAMMRWLGAPTPDIGETLRNAQMEAKLPPLVGSESTAVTKPALVEKVQAPAVPTRKAADKRRTMGTIVPERRDTTLGDRSAGATGPAFTEAA